MSFSSRKIPPRIVLYPKDVENITGRSDRTARNLIQKIKKAQGKSRNEFVTVKEFCAYTGIEEELIREFLVS